MDEEKDEEEESGGHTTDAFMHSLIPASLVSRFLVEIFQLV